uniref:U2 small nuclear ribonucleoprotein auxiliary factor 35 kDa subunit-related protein 1-like n=1 Tax=Scatophagus argus TaxID=75038 RepID=UPI001ED8132B|nr:U2 small nuclear ribonucleoprotein auxiliary factor 35 kDa subunit-related protein 1-like [Scatophagus argus]
MSKSMRGLCKEEDYAFLGMSEETAKEMETEGAGALEEEEEWRPCICCVFQARWRLEKEQQEKERLRKIEESKKEKEQQWQAHLAKLTSSQEKTLQDRLARLRRFREFERKVLIEDGGMEGGEDSLTVN